MRIGLLGIKTYPAFGGADRVVEKILENFSDKNHYFVYLLKSENKTTLRCLGNLHFIYIPSFPGKHLKPISYFFLCTLHFLFKGKYEIAHIHNSDFGVFTFFLRLNKNVKVLGTFHGNPYLRDKWGRFAKFYLKTSEKCFVKFSHNLTSVAKSKIIELNEKDRTKIRYIPNGMEANFEANVNSWLLSKYALKKNSYIMFACGRLDPTKGLHHLINAYLKGGIDYKLLVIGDFSHKPAYSGMIEKLASQDESIILHRELLQKSELLTLIKNCRVFVFPSEVEAMSMVLLEAVSCKVPLVCSDIQENKDVVGEQYKYLYSVMDENDLHKKVRSALDDPEINKLVQELFSNCINNFNWKKISCEYESVYEKLFKSN